MAKVTINENTCKGCELCTTACPKHIISLAKDKLNLKGIILRASQTPTSASDVRRALLCVLIVQ